VTSSPTDTTGIFEGLQARTATYTAAYPHLARRMLGKRPIVIASKTHAITVDLRTNQRTVTTAAQENPFVRVAKPKRAPARPFRAVKIAKIIDAVCKAWDVEGADLHTPCRRRGLAWPRFAAYRIISLTFGWSTPQIGRIFERDHTTIMHGLQRAQWLLERDRDWSRRYACAVAELKSGAEQ